MSTDLPREWSVRSLPEVIDFREGPGILAKDFRDAGVPLIRLAGVTTGALLNGCNYLDPAMVEQKWAHFRLEVGDTLLSTSASLGRVARVESDAAGSVPYTGIIRMRPSSDEVTRDYVACLLTSPSFTHQIAAMGAGSVMQHFGPSHLRVMEVTVPPLADQRAITSVLGALDDKIESNRRLVRLQRAARHTLFRQTTHGLGKRQRLDAIADVSKRSVQPSAQPNACFEQFSIPAFDAGEDPDVCIGASMASGKTLLPSGPVVMLSKLNPRTPRIWHPIPSGVGIAVCSPEFVVLEPKPRISHAWLESCLRSDERFYADVMAGVSGTTGSRQRVKPSSVLAATVPVIDDDDQVEWAEFATPLIQREAALTRERRTLTAIRDALLPKLVSGRIRVPLSNDPAEGLGAAMTALDTAEC